MFCPKRHNFLSISNNNVNFVIYEQFKCPLHNLFGNESSAPMHQPLDAYSGPKYHNNKNI